MGLLSDYLFPNLFTYIYLFLSTNSLGTPDTLQAVIDSHAIPLLLRGMRANELNQLFVLCKCCLSGLFVFEKSVVEACMKTLKIIYQSDKAPGELVYEVNHLPNN